MAKSRTEADPEKTRGQKLELSLTQEIPMKGLFGLLIISFLGGFTPTLGESGTEVGARVPVNVAVPEQWRTPPFDRERVLTVPVGARISVLVRVRGGRFLAVSPNGDILVSQPSRGKILLIRQSRPSEVYELISGLRLPHGMVFHRIGDALYLYISESNKISRFLYSNAPLQRKDAEIVVPNLPDRSSRNLGGAYGHEL